jgi:hypothetical protein
VRTTTKIAVWAATSVAIAALAAPAHADKGLRFRNPSGNISCSVTADDNNNGVAVCDVGESTWGKPPANCDVGMSMRFSLANGQSNMFCFTGALLVPGVDTLPYGQPRFFAGITCDTEPDPAGVRCTDANSHFFQVSTENYSLG